MRCGNVSGYNDTASEQDTDEVENVFYRETVLVLTVKTAKKLRSGIIYYTIYRVLASAMQRQACGVVS